MIPVSGNVFSQLNLPLDQEFRNDITFFWANSQKEIEMHLGDM